jgi:anaerobic selenocysteine-containing dehydrogenase
MKTASRSHSKRTIPKKLMVEKEESKMGLQEKTWQWEEDGLTVTRGSAWSGPGCHEGCGVLLYTNKEAKLVKVEGDPKNPYNQGRLCVRCLALPEVTYHPDRLKYPMKRMGKRGENKWRRISWEDAYDEIATKFNKIKEEYGAQSVVFGQGTGRDVMMSIASLCFSFGSGNHVVLGQSGTCCFLPRFVLMMATAGTFCVTDFSQYFADRYDSPDWKVPECMMIWGNNALQSNADTYYGHWIVDCMKRGTKLIVVDPRLTWLASRAELFLQIRPGTDGALSLGMLNVIIKEGLYDKEFVDKWTYGFDKLAERVTQYPVERVAEITWIPKEKIIAAARMYAKSKPASIHWGLAIDMAKEASPAGQSISSLWAITGNLDVPGGNITAILPYGLMLMGDEMFDTLSDEVKANRLGVKEYPLVGSGRMYMSPDVTMDAMMTGEPYPIKGLFVMACNPLPCPAAEPKNWYKAINNVDFNVWVDLFMTPSIVAHADIVLPAATYPERDGLRAMLYHVQAINKVTQVEECKSDMQIALELGKRLNPEAWPWDNVQDWFTSKIKNTGLTFQELRNREVPLYPPFEYKKYEKGKQRHDGKPGFDTPTGRFELYSTALEHFGLDPLPYYGEPMESPLRTPHLMKEYPLILTTGARTWGYFHSEHRQIASLRALHPWPQVEMHPETAEKYGIEEGDWVWVENSRGRCRQRAKLTPTIPTWAVHAEHGWWYPEKEAAEPTLFGTFDSNPNNLIKMDCGRSGYGADYKCLICKIYKVEKGEM